MTTTRPHIAYVLKRFPRISETFVAAELIELERQGTRVTVFALARPDEPFTHGFLSELRAPVVYLPYRPIRQPLRVVAAVTGCLARSPRRWMRVARKRAWPPRAWWLLVQATVLRHELARCGIDHVHAHFATNAARLAWMVRRMGGPPYSVTAHAKDIYHEKVQVKDLEKRLGRASFVATVSEANREYLRAVLDGRVIGPCHPELG